MTFDPMLPFTRQQGLAAGLTDKMLRGPRFRRLYPGVHLAADVPLTDRIRTLGALAPFGAAGIATHVSAARVHGLHLPHDPREFVTVGSERDRRRITGIRCVVRRGPSRLVGGVRVSTPGRLFIELAEELPLPELVAAGDELLRRGLIGTGALSEACRRSAAPGAPVAQATLPLLDRGAASRPESLLRVLLHLAGFPAPTTQFAVVDDYGELVRCYDLAWPAAKTAVEYDGSGHRSGRRYQQDIYRDEATRDDGWQVVRVASDGLFNQPDRTLERVAAALRRGGLDVPDPDPAWGTHFPVRRKANFDGPDDIRPR